MPPRSPRTTSPVPRGGARAAPPGPRSVPAAWSACVGIAFGALYLWLAPPVSGNKDAAEFTLVLALAGVSHPTGYPLYTLLGHGFVSLLHALGASWGYAANAWSAIGAAVAMALFHALACRIVPAGMAARRPRFLFALLATAVAGLNPVWLIEATLAEVYSWHLAWVCGACLAALGIVRSLAARGAQAGDAPRLPRLAVTWGMIAGLGLAHHATAVLFVVPLSAVIVVALIRAGRWSIGLAVGGLAAALIPLASYGFILWRAWHPAAVHWQTLDASLGAVIAHATGAEYRDLLGRFAPSEMQRGLFRGFIYPVIVPGLAAFLWATLRTREPAERLARWAIAIAALLQTAYGFSYAVSDPSSYFLPAIAIGLLAIPLAGAWLLRRPRLLPAAGILAGAGLVALGVLWIPLGLDVRSDIVAIESRFHAAWRAIPAGEGIVLWRDDMVPLVRGYQLLDGERTDLYVQDPYTLTWPGPRRAFTARFGFDPLAGMGAITARNLDRIPENINRQTPLPVFLFDPWRPAVTPFAKPPAAGSGGNP